MKSALLSGAGSSVAFNAKASRNGVKRTNFVGLRGETTPIVVLERTARKARSARSAARRTVKTCAAPEGANALPWQVAMSEVKKRRDIKSIMIIGAGPIVIGQACEFDYSGTQACKSLRKEGYKVILLNSNPATIMTDPGMADRTYIGPMTPELVEQILAKVSKLRCRLSGLGLGYPLSGVKWRLA
eukprot:gene4407-14532_t